MKSIKDRILELFPVIIASVVMSAVAGLIVAGIIKLITLMF